MRKYGAPCGRCSPASASQRIAGCENTFFQMEGLMIDKDISIST
ncbi:MAG: hypothetical protein ACLRSY_00950 [Acutalibacter sp.]